MNKPCHEEKTGVAVESGPGDTAYTAASGPLEHTTNLDTDSDYPVHLYDDYDSDNGNKNADNEVPRRKGHLGMSINGVPSRSSLPGPMLELGRMAEILRVLLVCSPCRILVILYRSCLTPSWLRILNIYPFLRAPFQ